MCSKTSYQERQRCLKTISYKGLSLDIMCLNVITFPHHAGHHVNIHRVKMRLPPKKNVLLWFHTFIVKLEYSEQSRLGQRQQNTDSTPQQDRVFVSLCDTVWGGNHSDMWQNKNLSTTETQPHAYGKSGEVSWS